MFPISLCCAQRSANLTAEVLSVTAALFQRRGVDMSSGILSVRLRASLSLSTPEHRLREESNHSIIPGAEPFCGCVCEACTTGRGDVRRVAAIREYYCAAVQGGSSRINSTRVRGALAVISPRAEMQKRMSYQTHLSVTEMSTDVKVMYACVCEEE